MFVLSSRACAQEQPKNKQKLTAPTINTANKLMRLQAVVGLKQYYSNETQSISWGQGFCEGFNLKKTACYSPEKFTFHGSSDCLMVS